MRPLICALLALLAAAEASAIVRRHDRDDALYRELAKGHDAVVDLNLPGGAGTLIAPRWVLTAAHAAALMKKEAHQVKIAGRAYAVARTVSHPGGEVGKDDLALLELAEAVTGATPVPVYEGRAEAKGDVVTFAGQGFSGDGVTGPNVRDGVRRGAMNRIESVREKWLTFLFDAPPAGEELEGISGPGDSGGPALMTVDGKVFVVGVSSAQDSRATAGKEGVYGVTEYYVRVSSYGEWIRGTMGGGAE
jgi:Trypsin